MEAFFSPEIPNQLQTIEEENSMGSTVPKKFS